MNLQYSSLKKSLFGLSAGFSSLKENIINSHLNELEILWCYGEENIKGKNQVIYGMNKR